MRRFFAQNVERVRRHHRQSARAQSAQIPQDVVLHHARRPTATSPDRGRSHDGVRQSETERVQGREETSGEWTKGPN